MTHWETFKKKRQLYTAHEGKTISVYGKWKRQLTTPQINETSGMGRSTFDGAFLVAALCLRSSRSAFFLSNTVSSSASWYRAVRITDLSKSRGSPLSLVRPSATMCPVGHHLGSNFALWMLWRIIATSIAVLLSSRGPPLPREIRWSNNDRQSVIYTNWTAA